MRLKVNFLVSLILCAAIVSGCAGCLSPVVEPPTFNFEEPKDTRPGGDPSEWENSEPAGTTPSDWGSGEPVMNDGTVPGQTKTVKTASTKTEPSAGDPSDWGNGEPILDQSTKPGAKKTVPIENGDLIVNAPPQEIYPVTPKKSAPIKNEDLIVNAPPQEGFSFTPRKSRPMLRFSEFKAALNQPVQEFNFDFFTDESGKPVYPMNPSTAHQAGLGNLSFNGKNRPSGDIFDMSFRNFSGFDLQLGLSLGSFINPSDSSYQRMMTTERKIVTCPDADTTTVAPVTGFCVDPKKYPPSPAEDAPETGWTINPSLFRLEQLGGGMTEIEPPALQLDEDEDSEPAIPISQGIPWEQMLPKDHIFFKNPPMYDEFDDDPFLGNYLNAPFAPKTTENMLDNGTITVPGFPLDKAKMTISQWAIWNMFSDFTPDDGFEKIESQTQGNPNITPQMKEDLNKSLWEGIDLVQKEIKKTPETADNDTEESAEDEPFQFKVRVSF